MSSSRFSWVPGPIAARVSVDGGLGGGHAGELGDEGLGGITIEGSGHEKALALGTTELHEPVELALVLDALGDDLEPEALGQADDGGDQGRAPGVRVDQRVDERLVDLEDVHRKALEGGQGGIAGAEVVHSDTYTHFAQLR